jgi:hypothetical protein
MLQRQVYFTPGGREGFIGLSSTLPAQTLKPEETKSYEMGLNLNFIGNRLGLDVTVYKENTFNQLFTVSLPEGSGAADFFTNAGNIENKGLEATLKTIPIQGKYFKWNIDFNFSRNRNKVVSLYGNKSSIIIGSNHSTALKLVKGHRWGDLYGIGFKRDDQGRVIVGNDGVPKFTNSTSVLLGNYLPKWTGNISSGFVYNNFTLHFLISYRQGGIIFSYTSSVLNGIGLTKKTLKGRQGGLIFGKNFFKKYTAVKKDGSPNNIPIDAQAFWSSVGGRNYTVPEPFVQDATNMRLRELSLGYSLPHSLLAKMGLTAISNVKFSLVGRNLFYFYRSSPLVDSSLRNGTGTASSGRATYIRPTIRNYGVNLSIKF